MNQTCLTHPSTVRQVCCSCGFFFAYFSCQHGEVNLQAAVEERARVAKEKELETARLRARQERAADRQAEIDELRARRSAAVLCCACCAALCCAMLRCAALLRAMLRCAVLCCAVLCCAVLCCSALRYAALRCAVLCYAVRCGAVPAGIHKRKAAVGVFCCLMWVALRSANAGRMRRHLASLILITMIVADCGPTENWPKLSCVQHTSLIHRGNLYRACVSTAVTLKLMCMN